MRIANQLYDRSSLNLAKKDAKLTVDKQATAGTAASVPKKVIDLMFFYDYFEENFHPLKKTRTSSQSSKDPKLRKLSNLHVTARMQAVLLLFCI